MPALLIETGTERGMTAIVDGEAILFHAILPLGYHNSRYLLPEIEKGLQQLNLAVKNLQYIACGQGPGSYTGIRVGATVAKSLAFACKLPLIGISTLQTFVPDKEGAFAVLIDAKIGGVYMIKGSRKGNEICYDSKPEIVENSKAEQALQGIQMIVTPQEAPLKKKLPSSQLIWLERDPNPAHMAKLAQLKYRQGEYSLDASLPLEYLRKTQAEIEKEHSKEL